MAVTAIVNPAAGRGAALQRWEKVRVHLQQPYQTFQTARPGHATELAAKALCDGVETIVAVGGDGTINEVVNGLFHRNRMISDSAALAILAHGTGSDFQRMLHMPHDARRCAQVIDARKPKSIDIMKVRYTTPLGVCETRYCLNIASFGMGGIIAARVTRSGKYFGGRISFALATLRTALTFGGRRVTLSFDSHALDVVVSNVVVGNGRYHGAGMLACPRAVMDDGFMDLTVIPFLRLPELIRNLPMLYNGEIYSVRNVQFFRSTYLRADSAEDIPIEIDGEALGRVPVEISIIPRAVAVLGIETGHS